MKILAAESAVLDATKERGFEGARAVARKLTTEEIRVAIFRGLNAEWRKAFVPVIQKLDGEDLVTVYSALAGAWHTGLGLGMQLRDGEKSDA